VNSGRKNSKTNIGSHGHSEGTRPGEKRKTPKNLSVHESEERGCEESVGLYAVCIYGQGGGCGRSAISAVIHI
jgi:hypothetical protein